MTDQIFALISNTPTPGFFITTEISREGADMPLNIERFIQEKLESIHQGSNGRKFVYNEKEWRIIFTFFPTNEVVDEKYALKNKVFLKHT